MKVFVQINDKYSEIVGTLPEDLEISLPNLLGYRKKMRDQFGQLTNRLYTKYNRISRSVPVGLTDRLVRVIEEFGYECKTLDKRTLHLVNPDDVLKNIKSFPITLRPYQKKAFIVGIQESLMTFSIGTGGGKSYLFAALTMGMDMKSLILVNREDILAQHYNTLTKIFPHNTIGLIQGDTLNYNFPVCIGMVQTINAKMNKKGERANNPRYRIMKYLESVHYLISDEMHHSQSATWKNVVRACKNKRYHHGFSGSPWDRGSANLELETVCGSIKYKITSSELIDQGWLARPHIIFHHYPHNENYITGGNFQNLYTNTIVENKDRNRAVVNIIADEYHNTDRKILVIVNRIKHGYSIINMLREVGINDSELGYLHGSKGKIIREKGKAKFEKGEIRILVASHIFNEGIDIPSCDTLIKADALGGGEDIYESEGIRSMVQQIGRVLRKPIEPGASDVDTSKEHIVYVHDFIDKQNEYVKKHTTNRMDTCRKEMAFIVRVEGEDHD